jgi:hypothetical protein
MEFIQFDGRREPTEGTMWQSLQSMSALRISIPQSMHVVASVEVQTPEHGSGKARLFAFCLRLQAQAYGEWFVT